MGIVNGPITLTGEVGAKPVLKRMTTTDNLATITAAGYLNENLSENLDLSTSDLIMVIYNYVEATDSGDIDFFSVSISNGVITLAQDISGGNVELPTVDGNFALFANTDGKITDDSISPSDASKSKVVMADGATVVDELASFADTSGTVQSLGASLLAKTTAAYGGGGTSNAFTATGLTASSIVVASIASQSNTASIVKVEPSADTLTVTFSADPGASTTVNYIALSAAV